MFKNCVFKTSVSTKEWFKAAGIRAIKTMAQTAGGMLTVGMTLAEVNWMYVGSVALVAGIYSILMSIVGIKEVPQKEG